MLADLPPTVTAPTVEASVDASVTVAVADEPPSLVVVDLRLDLHREAFLALAVDVR